MMRARRIFRIIAVLVALGMLATAATAQDYPPVPQKASPEKSLGRPGMPLSASREAARFLVENFPGGDIPESPGLERQMTASTGEEERSKAPSLGGDDILVNQDFNNRPQNETAIAIDPNDPNHIVTGYNDYRVGWPVGGGFSTTFDGGQTFHDGLVTFPALIAPEDFPGFAEPPVATGDPAVAFANDGTVYQSSLGFSASFCEGGVFVYRSDDGGIAWWRPVVATGTGIVDYWPYAFDCSVILDKEYMAVDNSGGPHDGRVYVTYTRFLFDAEFNYLESPIYLSYSDDGGESFTVVGEINGASKDLCEFQVETTGGKGPGATGRDKTRYDCDEDQFSVPVVGSDGTLYVQFANEQNQSEWEPAGDFDNQVLMVRVNPDTFAVDGPYQITMLADGLTNYPINPDIFRQTVCNGGWRLNAFGNLAIGPNGELYSVWADDRNGDLFPFPTFINPDGSCPDDLHTSTDVFVRTSTDGGQTWSRTVRISQDPENFDNWFPWVAVGDDGTAYTVYYDRRLSGNNTLTDAWVATSRDHGRTWQEFRVSDESSDFSNAFFGTPDFIGDYNGIDATDHTAYPFWTDSRVDGDSDVYMDVLNP
jgi:hypothetical protein